MRHAADADTDDDEKPDIHLVRLEVLRKLINAKHEWRRCPRPRCKRARACASVGWEPCALKFHYRPISPQRESAALAALHKALKRRMAEIEAEGEGA